MWFPSSVKQLAEEGCWSGCRVCDRWRFCQLLLVYFCSDAVILLQPAFPFLIRCSDLLSANFCFASFALQTALLTDTERELRTNNRDLESSFKEPLLTNWFEWELILGPTTASVQCLKNCSSLMKNYSSFVSNVRK